ncbi:serine/threonine protein kinase [bacterium]|jgi:eukaryotic-like serine/threonine-protein kinase|nr:serine/threonine protein kinase [bacterium]MDB4802632.1 serine/threonine protein kinase [bacterium]
MDEHKEENTEDMDITRIFEPDQEKLSEQKKYANARDLSTQYENIISRQNVAWDQEYRLKKVLGSGGQGTVMLAERSGAFNVSFDLALKFFRPDGYYDIEMYRSEMARLAEVTMDVSKIQQDHILDVYNVIEYEGILVLVTEWVDGIDLRQLVAPSVLKLLKSNVKSDRWAYINDVVMTDAGFQSRMLPSMVLAILRECIAGLSALHRQNVIHADMKPANVMVKQTGNCKIIDLGSSFLKQTPPRRPTWTWRYAPVEVLKGAEHTFLSDLASLGYVALELLSGKIPFVGVSDRNELIQLKEDTWHRIPDILPKDVARNSKIVEMLSKMIAPDPADRFSSLEDADFHDSGAAAIERQLVKVDMDTVVSNDLRVLLQDLHEARLAESAA